MALEDKSYQLSYTLGDDDGAKSTHTAFLARVTLIAAVETARDAYQTLLLACSDASVISRRVVLPTVESAPVFTVGSDVERKVVMGLLTNAGTVSTFAIPGCKEAVLDTNKRDLDRLNVDVAALTAAYIDGGIADFNPTDNRAAPFVRLTEIYKQNRRSLTSSGKRKG